jgi:crotonobetainyl-CoA:carnitine CoA-transferase CaiB-like acyl-CoA transferase
MSAIKPGAFDGVRVLSLAEQYPGPYATLLMADFGADVIMVERPDGGDPARIFQDFFAALARNKRSVVLDLKSPEGRGHFLGMVQEADIVIEGFKPGTMERLGFGYADLKNINERLIYISISGFGQNGPYRDRVAHDLSYQAVAGLLFAKTGPCDAPPALSLADLCGGMFAAFSAATALYAREKTGFGTYVDVSMTDGLVSWMTSFLTPQMNKGISLSVSDLPGYGAFRCSDGGVLTLSIVHEDHFWKRLCDALDMAAESGLDQALRTARNDELRALVRSRISQHALAYWAEIFDDRGIPWSPLLNLAEVIDDRHFHERGMFHSIDDRQGGSQFHVMQPLKFSRFTSSLRRLAPMLGEHNQGVLKN